MSKLISFHRMFYLMVYLNLPQTTRRAVISLILLVGVMHLNESRSYFGTTACVGLLCPWPSSPARS